MSKFTRDAIKNSFIKLLNERPLSQIKVKDIVEDCGINRNTFYYYFHDIPSLIEEMVMEEAERIIREYPSPETIEDLKSMWDPYGNLKNLPVAVVNEDSPVEYEGKKLNIGEEMVENLRESDALDFRFMDAGQAQKGLADGSWYMVITIPENFSRNAATLLDEKPEKMELTFETNPGTNYIASKMGESAAEKLCEETASQVTETYTKILFEQLAMAKTAGQMKIAARTDLGSLPDTLRSLTGAAGKLYEGACQVSSGVNTTSEKLTELETATSGFPAAAQGVKSLEEGFETLTSGNEALLAGAKGLNKAGADLDDGLRAAVSGGDTLAEGMRSLDGGVRAYTGGVSLLARNSAALTGGTRQLLEGSDELISGIDSFAGGTESLYEGVSRLTQNSGQLTEGAKLLADGSEQIQTGAGRLYQGSEELDAGMQELMEGSETLAAALEDGAGDLSGQEFSEETISMFASPLEAKEKKITNVENNGHGMAPYMMSVGLWVGCLAFCLMYPLTQYTGRLKSGFSWWASKAVVLYPVAVLQGILLIVLLHVADGFQPARMMETICFACLTAVSFTSIMYFFNITLGKVGSFLMLIFMVIQLSGSAGTYPVEISPPFVSRIHAFLPFTCTVDAFRSAISGGESILPSVTPLVVLTLVFTGLTILQFQHMARCRKTGKKLLIDWMEEKGLA